MVLEEIVALDSTGESKLGETSKQVYFEREDDAIGSEMSWKIDFNVI